MKKVMQSDRPRLVVNRSLKHIYAQLIDENGRVLASACSRKMNSGGNVPAAKAVGQAVGEKAVAAGYKRVRFDRNGYIYHGRVQALADAAREAGLMF